MCSLQSLLNQLGSVGEDFAILALVLSVLVAVTKLFKEQYIITVTVSQLLGCHWVLVHNGEGDPVPHMG